MFLSVTLTWQGNKKKNRRGSITLIFQINTLKTALGTFADTHRYWCCDIYFMNKVYDFSFDQIVTSPSTDRSSLSTGQSSTDRSSPALTGQVHRQIKSSTDRSHQQVNSSTDRSSQQVNSSTDGSCQQVSPVPTGQSSTDKSSPGLQWPCLTTTEGLQTTQRTPPLCPRVHVDSFPGDRCTGKVKTFYQKIRTLRKQTCAGSVKQEIKLVWPKYRSLPPYICSCKPLCIVM